MGRKKERRGRREQVGGSGRRVPVNEFVDMAPLDEVLRAVERFGGDPDWAVAGPEIVPLLPRRRPMPPAAGRPLGVLLPPGIMTGFGIDVGPAVLHVSEELLSRWDIDTGELVAQALTNVHLRTEGFGPRDLHADTVDGLKVRILQTGEGCASSLLLLPDELTRIFGSAAQRFVAPMRDLLVSLPADADPAFVGWLNDELASLDPNALALDSFWFDGGELRLEPIGPRVALA